MIKEWIQKRIQYVTIKHSGYFDPFYYLLTYPDCRRADVDPLFHFVSLGWREGRNPSIKFNTQFYLKNNPDVESAGINPLIHYLRTGQQEGRVPVPDWQRMEIQTTERPRTIDRLIRQIYQIGRKIFWAISPNYRLKVVHWAYRNFGFLFTRLPNYTDWRNSQTKMRTTLSYQQNLLDIQKVQPADKADGSIAVHIHIFYPDLAKEFARYLKNMPFTYDLYVSIPYGENLASYEAAFNGLQHCRTVLIKPVENRGRDLAPLFLTFGAELSKYAFLAHLHSKKSIYSNGATAGWREYLCNNLFGSEDRIRRIFKLMQGEQPRGIVYPQNYDSVPYWANTWLANRRLGQIWCGRLGISNIPRGYFDFPAGSMFWARGDALAPLFRAGIKLDDFTEESGDTDGTLAHCLERLFVLSSLSQNLAPAIIRDDGSPSWSSWRLDQLTNRSFQNTINLLVSPRIKLIGFDIFDTLLCRPLLDPETNKAIVSKRIGGDAGRLYAEYRGKAEQLAREAKGSDVGLDEIYANLGELTHLSQTNLQRLRRMEEGVEEASLDGRTEMVDLYKRALETGKKIALISDMFLPRSLIIKSLDKFGIEKWDALFLSNEIGLRKDHGDLYKHVLEYYGIKPEEMLMIGDNERSDVQIPSDMGMAFLHFFRPTELARGLPRFANLISQHEHLQNIDAEVTLGLVVRKNFSQVHYETVDPDSFLPAAPYNWGYGLVGPLLTSFAFWLHQKAQEDGIDKLFFLSREGRIMQQVYDAWWNDAGEDWPGSEYLVISRRAAGVAALSTFDEIIDIAKKDYFSNTLEKFLLTRFGISLARSEWEEYASPLRLEPGSIIRIENHQVGHLLAFLKSLETKIYAKAQAERGFFQRYLVEKGLSDSDRQAVVDIGYGGSVQAYLNKLLARKVQGYYLMTDERSERVASTYGVFLKGCFHGRTVLPPETSIMYDKSFALEKLLSSNEPQIEYYGSDPSGAIKGHYRDLLSEEIEIIGIRDQIQEGAMDYVGEARQIREKMLPGFQPSVWTARMLMDAFLPMLSNAETGLMSRIVLDDFYNGRDLVS
jgi:FMN phosphatase YigB (HAD superfamily)